MSRSEQVADTAEEVADSAPVRVLGRVGLVA